MGASGAGRLSLYDSLKKRKNTKNEWNFPNNQIISFNYLNEPHKLSTYLQFLEKCNQPIGIHAVMLNNMFFFIHNSIDFSNIYNYQANIIFGTNDDNRMPPELYMLRKSS